ncbi:alpha-ketoacid dehydrogenase subunit alpha/beta [Acrocarpospora macrocephala]|nr:dehydrogenase E1 component subunit alpha/beta [Acrocarpospora macrocephala]
MRVELYRRMARIRRFEERTAQLYRDGEIPGFVHVSIGQEAVAVGACSVLTGRDIITSTHRGHGHVLAKGGDMGRMFAELLGRADGSCRGRGGSMHIADLDAGVFGANGIVGAGLPIATGAAMAMRLRGTSDVAVAFFGDGAVAQGAFHEAVNLAAVKDLPIVFLCENNHFAEFSDASVIRELPLADRARGYGIAYAHADGNDVEAVARVMAAQVARVRSGAGPVLVEAETYRARGHYEGDQQRYRTPEDLAAREANDPLAILAARIRADGDGDLLAKIADEVEREVEAAIAFARAAPEPGAETLQEYVYSPVGHRPPLPVPADVQATPAIKTSRAIRAALEDELATDPSVFLAGIDVAAGGNVFGLTRGLHERFPGRLIDTPISETAIMGLGVGAAMSGLRPVVELMYLDFIGVCLDQLMNQAAKMRFMTGGAVQVPLTVRTQFGAGRSSGSQHSQSLEVLLAAIPGLKVVMPGTPADAYGLLRAAVRDPNPVIVIENRLLYEVSGDAPDRSESLELGRAHVVREGSDVTVVSYSRMAQVCLAAARELAGRGIECEVVDLRTIAPLDYQTIIASLAKTSRLLIAHEAITDFGVGAEISAHVGEHAFELLDAPIKRVGAARMPPPYAPNLERLWLPDQAAVVRAVEQLVAY